MGSDKQARKRRREWIEKHAIAPGAHRSDPEEMHMLIQSTALMAMEAEASRQQAQYGELVEAARECVTVGQCGLRGYSNGDACARCELLPHHCSCPAGRLRAALAGMEDNDGE